MQISLKELKNILVIQLGDIGDVVWTTPTILALKKSCPEARVSILLREDFGQLLEEDPSLHRVFEVRRYQGGLAARVREQIRFIRELRKQHFDLVIDLRADDRGAFLTYVTASPLRVTLPYGGVPFWRKYVFTHFVRPPTPPVKVRGAAEQSLRIVRALGVETDQHIPKLRVSKEIEARVQDILEREGIGGAGRWITVNLFARWSYKEWSQKKWVDVFDWLWDEYRLSTVIVGARDEKNKAEAVKSLCRAQILNIAGKTTLAELAGILARSSLHLGVDSAAPHIAAAVGTPTVTIYGPTDWQDWAPIGESHRVIVPVLECVPCYRKGCDGGGVSRCLEELTVEEVKEGIRRALDDIVVRSSTGLS